MTRPSILDILPTDQRLALAYAPRRARPATLALMGLDARLAALVRSSREPILGQLRCAWWRDMLARPAAERPIGDPLLEALAAWEGGEADLGGLIDGWEGMLGEAPLESAVFEALAEARAASWARLASLLGADNQRGECERAARNWAFADIAAHLADPAERARVLELTLSQDWRRPALGRTMRPLGVLHGLARRATRRGGSALLDGPGDLLAALRLGMLGR